MKYKIGDVARILGISADLLRYYEKKGVVTPMKDKLNDYRYYDAWDINFLMDCLWFKNFGFTIEQIADIVRTPRASDISDVLEYKEDELRSTIKRCELLLRRSGEHRQGLELIPALLGRCEISDSPEVIRYLNRFGDEYLTNAGLERITQAWLRVLPFNHRYFEMAEDGHGEDYRWGFSLGPDYARELDFPLLPPFVRMPAQRSIHTVFKSRGKGNFSPRLLDYAFDYAKSKAMEVCGPARGVLLSSLLENGDFCGYFEAWLPIA